MFSILIVEDDAELQKYLRELLLENGYSVRSTTEGSTVLELIEKVQPDLVVLDLGLPDVSGESVCQDIRKNYPRLPIIILTAKSGVNEIVAGLNMGADDYVTKPFVAEELLARIKSRLRQEGDASNKLKVGDLELDQETHEVKRDGKLLKLTPQEFKLLHYLMSNKGRVLTREMMLNRVWMYANDVETRVVDVYLGYLRRKIDVDQKKKLIQSVRGFGYMIKE